MQEDSVHGKSIRLHVRSPLMCDDVSLQKENLSGFHIGNSNKNVALRDANKNITVLIAPRAERSRIRSSS